MTERLADIGLRIDGMRQLDAVVNAMRGIAAARVQEAGGQLAAVDRYAALIAVAIGRAIALIPPTRAPPASQAAPPALVLFCAEQGFAGAFSERVLETAGADLPASALFLVGTRGMAAAAERGIRPGWDGAMPSHSAGIPKFADRITEALYAGIAVGKIDRLEAVFSRWRSGDGMTVERRRLLPFDGKPFPAPKDTNAPLLNLAPAVLLGELAADYLHAQLCQAALHAFVAENEARMQAMLAARSHIERKLAELQATQRRIRQEAITEEIIELAAGETASRRS